MPKTIHGKKIDEANWEKAKKLASEQGRGGDYQYITGIVKKMEGINKAYADIYDTRSHKDDLYRSLAVRDTFTVWTPSTLDTNVIYKSVPEGTDLIQVLRRKGAPDLKTVGRPIGGYASTEGWDRQDEFLFAKGLDFTECVQHGWYNDNHRQGTADVVGVPVEAELHRHPSFGFRWYSKGFMLEDYAPADGIWNLAKSLAKTGRRLGFSVEGKVTERDGPKITKALIRNIAITANPVNTDCTWEILARAMSGDEEFYKALTIGTAIPGAAGGAILVPDSLEGHMRCTSYACPVCSTMFATEYELREHRDSTGHTGQEETSGTMLDKAQAMAWIMDRNGAFDAALAERLYNYVSRGVQNGV